MGACNYMGLFTLQCPHDLNRKNGFVTHIFAMTCEIAFAIAITIAVCEQALKLGTFFVKCFIFGCINKLGTRENKVKITD